MPPNIYAFNSPYAIAANSYYQSNVRKPTWRDINPFTGQPFLQPRQFSPLEIQAMQQFNIDPASLATPQGQQDFKDAVALIQQQNAQAAAAQFMPMLANSTMPGANIHNPDPAAHMTDPNMPFVNFVASNPRGGLQTSVNTVTTDPVTGAQVVTRQRVPYQMTDADKTLLTQTFAALPDDQSKTNYANLMAANGITTNKENFQQYVNRINKTNTALHAPGGFLQTDPLAGL